MNILPPRLINEIDNNLNYFEKLSRDELPIDSTFYKYRSLGSDCDVCRFKQIILHNQLYASDFFKMNDPMEGAFNSLQPKYAQTLMEEKVKTFVCSMATSSKNYLMWNYYGGGGSGCCIKFTLNKSNNDYFHVRKMNYVDKISDADKFEGTIEEKVIHILTRKSIEWKHECEVRALTKKHDVSININKIIFGNYTDNNLQKELSQFIRNNSDGIEICKYIDSNIISL